MKRLIIALFLFSSFAGWAQSKTTVALQAKFEGSRAFYFYKNTLRMLNQNEDKDFDDLIKNVEKLEFLIIDKDKKSFAANDYQKLTSDYKSENYESIVNARKDGRNFDVYLNDKKGSKPGTVILVNDSTSLYVLDMIGTIDVSKAGALFSAIGGNTDISKTIKSLSDRNDKKKGKHVKID